MEKEILEILKTMQSDMKTMKSDMKTMQNEQKETNKRLERVENKADIIEVQVKENTQILKVLQHSSQVHKAEIDKININLAKEAGELKKQIKNVEDRIDSIEETNKSIIEMYGEHEVEIRKIRRRYI